MKAVRAVRRGVVLSGLLFILLMPGCPQPNQTNGRDPAPEFLLLQEGTRIDAGTSCDIGTICIDTAASLTFTIKNMGTENLNLTGAPDLVALSGSDTSFFTVTVQPTTPIPSGDTSEFTLRFTPTGSDAKLVTLRIEHDDADATPFTFTVTGTGFEPATRVPATGQTLSYATGDDGYQRAGAVWPSPRFVENLDGGSNPDGTVTDNLTGLMWEQTPSNSGRTFDTALTYANNLTLAGHTDWRLANIRELQSLINAAQSSPAGWLNGQEFSGVANDDYMSSTTSPADFNMVCILRMSSCGWVIRSSKPVIAIKYAWAVRGGSGGSVSIPKTGQIVSYASGDDGDLEAGVDWPSPRFVDNGDGTVTDTLTGLVWEESPSTTRKTWADALAYANDLELGEYSDWRLANRNELWSLVNYGSWDNTIWLIGQGFRNVQSDSYWTSTTYPSDTNKAWVVYMISGNTVSSVSDKTAAGNYAWAVR